MAIFNKIRRILGVAGLQTFKHNPANPVVGVTVNGTAATITDANGVTTITSPTLVGGENIVVSETTTPPSVGPLISMPIVATTAVTLTRTTGGVSTSLVQANAEDVKSVAPAFNVTGTTKTNR